MSLTNEQIIEAIGQKTVLEVVELIKAMEETFGVTAAVAAAGPAAAAAVVASFLERYLRQARYPEHHYGPRSDHRSELAGRVTPCRRV